MTNEADAWLSQLWLEVVNTVDTQDLVRGAYESMLGYEDAHAMEDAARRLDYWESRLESGDLRPETFLPAFMEAASDTQGRYVPDRDHLANQRVVDEYREAADVLRDLTSDALPATAVALLDGLGREALSLRDAGHAETATVSDEGFDLSALPPLDARIESVDAGALGESVEVKAAVVHAGGGSAEFSLSQGNARGDGTVPLGDTPGEEIVSLGFATDVLSPGRARVELDVGGDEGIGDARTFGLYEDTLQGRDLTLQWRDPAELPHDRIGLVSVENDVAGGALNVGTGFLISPQHVMTNAHVLGDGGLSTDLSGIQGAEFMLAAEAPLGADAPVTVAAAEAHVQQAEFGDHWPGRDLGILRLDEPVLPESGGGAFDWFWHQAGEGAPRDMVGEAVEWVGYPQEGLDQGGELFHWGAESTVTAYTGGEGGFLLGTDAGGAGGASGSPVFRHTDEGVEFLGAFTGALGDDPAVAGLDARAHDWALTLVQEDGHGLDRAFVDGPVDDAALGPVAELAPESDGLVA